MWVTVILLVLVVIAVIAVFVINRATGARPDRPLEGAEDDSNAPAKKSAGDPGSEDMDVEEPGDPSPGPREDDPPG